MKKNSFDSDTLKNNIGKKHTMEEMKNRNGFLKKLLCLAVVFAGIGICEVAQGQTQYVFYNAKSGYVYNNNYSLIVNATFSPSAMWVASGTLGNTERTIYSYIDSTKFLNASAGNGNAVSLGNNSSNVWRQNNNLLALYGYNNYYYLNYNSNTFTVRRNNFGDRFTPYEVKTSTGLAVSTKPTITGSDVLTTTGNHSYPASGAMYQQGGYTNYRFNNNDHFFDGNNSITPAAATCSGYTWSLTANNYATVNASTGVVSVDSLPETDLTLTLTCTASFTGGTPTVPANTTLSETKQITIQGTKPSAPIISVDGTEITLSTNAIGSTTIRYTLDGTDPTATTGTVYSGTFDVSGQTSSPVTIKAVTVRNSTVSSVSEEEVTLTLPEPVITVNAEAGTASIACSNTGASIYYTTDGSEPSASNGTKYTGTITGLSMMTTIKAIAIRDGWNNSSVASDILTIPSGVSGGVVTLFDYEPHSWSYYSDATLPQMLRSLNPADVKITYNGNGTGTVSTTNGATPANNSWTAKASGVKVSSTEGDSTFVYYKTLERTDGSTSDNPSGRCAYTIIPNPFSVRPTYQYATGDLNKYCGFYAWRITTIKNGKIYTAATGGTQKTAYTSGNLADANILIADETYYFEPDGEYGMEVELEALWARAYVSTNTNDMATYVSDGPSPYERNFHVVTETQYAYSYQKSYPLTISSLYPDGASGGGSVQGYSSGGWWNTYTGFTAAAATKFEYISFNNMNNHTISANGNNLVIGRGVTGTINVISGLSADATNTFRLRVESGTYNNLYFMGDNGVTTGHETAVMGCDYDRATGTDSNLRVQTDILMSDGGTAGTNATVGTERLHCTVKSGNYDLGSYGGNVQFYMSSPGQNNYAKRTLIIEGGNFSDVSGGMESNTVGDHLMFDLRVKGGTINGATYGAAQNAAGSGHRRFIITGGDFKGWIAGGANGTNTSGGALTGTTHIYFGGVAKCDSEGDNTTIGPGNATGGNIFGAGSGNASAGNNATVGQVESSTIVIADECEVEHNVYGGGNYGFVSDGSTHKSDIYFYGGTVNGSIHGGSNMQKGQNVNIYTKGEGTVKGGIYGGSNQRGVINYNVTMNIGGGTIEQGVFGGGYGTNSNSCDVTGTVNITMTGGIVLSGLYGGGNVNSTVNGKTTININGGTIGASATDSANVHGGGLGSLTRILDSVEVNIGANVGDEGATIHGDVYGGSAEGKTNGNSSRENSATTTVTLNAGTIHGSVYGGGLGSSNAADVYGPVTVTVNGGSVNNPGTGNPASIFGCNNANGSPKSTVDVIINSSDATTTVNDVKQYAINGVYGGGNKAHYDYDNANYPTVTVNGCATSIRDVYGGGNAAAVPSTHVTINGGDIDRVFGGGNGESGTPAHIGYKNNTESSTNNPYTANGNVSVSIKGGTINQVFGGSNAHGLVKGSIAVEVDKSTAEDACEMHIAEVYGGGNKAASAAGSITVGCTGGEGEGIGDLYGGANQAGITGNIGLNITGGSINRIFGGNNITGAIDGTITVNVNWKTTDPCGYNYIGTVFGGGNNASYNGTPAVNIKNGTVSQSVYGGGKGTGAVVKGTNVTIGDADASHCAVVVENVYGGGDAAAVQGNTLVTYNDSNASSSVSNLFGGGNKAGLSGTATVNMTAGKVTAGIYGGCNSEGGVQGAITVNINGGTLGASGDGNAMSSGIFGGGYGSATSTEGNVTVNIGDEAGTYIPVIYGDIYGGSALGNVNDAATDTTIVNFLNGTLHGNLYGGGLGDADNAAKVNGKVIVNISNSTQTEANCNIDLSDATIYGCNNAYGSPQDSVIVNIYKTAHNTTNAATYTVNDGTNGEPTYAIDQVFGGGNQADYAPENGAANSTKVAKVHIFNCNNTIRRVFGGGNAADATGVETIIDGGRFDYVFGGGNGEDVAANIGAGGTNLTVNSGIINHLFGGSNERGTITGSMAVAVNNTGGCTENIKEFFCGNNLADIGTSSNPVNIVTSIGCGTIFGDVYGGCNLANIYGNVTLTIEGGTMDNVYGGSKGRSATSDPNNSTPKAANIYGNTTLNIYAGAIGNAFGGSNINGNITGSIQVNVDWAQSSCSDKSIGNIFGASNLATYTPTISGKYPEVNILNGTVTQNVYGGGKGESAVVTGSPVVTIGDITSGHESYEAVVTGDVYGGGDAADVLTGTPEVKVLAKDNTSIGNVYGGGNAADVPSTIVTIDGGTIGMVFGGGHGDKTANPQTEANVSGSSNVTITGGTINKVFATANSKGTVGSSTVTVEKGATSRAMHITEVYGGGNEAAGNAGTLTIGCTGGASEGIGSVFGGANNADISSDITLNITGGRITDAVYGGNNSGGTVNGDIAINVTWANSGSCDTNYLGSVYGGGYGASTATSGDVTVNIGSYAESTLSGSAIVSGDVYGGSALGSVCDAATDEVSVNILSGTVNGNVYGGGLGDASDADKGKVNGAVTVNIGTIDNSDNLIGYATLGGMVFGGNNTNGSPQADVNVNIYKTAHTSGNDLNALAAKAGSSSIVEIEDLKAVAALIESSTPSDTVAGNAMFAIKAVYGGGNKANYIPASGKSTVTVFGCEENTIKYVYGGGRAASSNETHVEIKGGHIYQVFAGGDGSTGVGANIGLMPDNTTEYGTGNVNLTISAGAIYQAFGGSNTLGKINGETYFNLEKDASCDLQIVETFAGNNLAEIDGDQTFTIKCGTYWNDVYGGSNKAPITGNVTLNIEGGVINRAFGGSKSANIDGNVTVNVYGGTIHELYGGNNVSGNITGSITVNVDWTEENECEDSKNIDYVYGGGNLADYEPTDSNASSPQVNIIKATVDTAVYGGGYMAFVKSNPNVVIGADRTKNMAGTTISTVSNLPVSIGLNVFGGGNAAEIKGNTNVKVTGISTVGKNIFGGGNEAAVTGNTEVLLDKRAKVFGNVYGGGNRGAIGGDTKVIVNSIK